MSWKPWLDLTLQNVVERPKAGKPRLTIRGKLADDVDSSKDTC